MERSFRWRLYSRQVVCRRVDGIRRVSRNERVRR